MFDPINIHICQPVKHLQKAVALAKTEKCCILGFGGSEALRHVCMKNLPLKVPLFWPVLKAASFMRLSNIYNITDIIDAEYHLSVS